MRRETYENGLDIGGSIAEERVGRIASRRFFSFRRRRCRRCSHQRRASYFPPFRSSLQAERQEAERQEEI